MPGTDLYTPAHAAAALKSLSAGNLPVMERLDQLSYLERALSENRIDGAEKGNKAEELFHMLRNAEQYGGARDAELAAIRASTTYRLAGIFGRMAGFATHWLKRDRGIISDPSKK